MKAAYCILAALAVFAFARPSVAQDDKAETPEKLLARYLVAKEADKSALRKQLLALGAPTLQKAIAALAYAKPEKTGTVKMTTKCPDGFTRPMWVYVPKTYDPAKSYPMIVHLHGGVSQMPLEHEQINPGEYEMNSWREALPDDWKEEVILLGCSAGVPETTEQAMWWRNTGQKNILHLVRDVKRALNVDDDRVFIEGHSDGGSGAFGMALRRPDTFAGFFAMCGHPLVPMTDGVATWLENFRGSNVYAVNGGADPLYPAAQMTPIYDQAKGLGVSIDYMAIENLGHQIGNVLDMQVPAILKDRVARFKRDRAPAKIDWTTDSADTGRRAWLGIDEILDLGDKNGGSANAEIRLPKGRARLGVQIDQQEEAPTVETVIKDSPAEKMGIKAGDAILKIDDTAVASMQELINALGKKNPGDAVSVTIKRDGKEQLLKGKFKTPEEEMPKFGLSARVGAKFEPGVVRLCVRNAGKVSLYVNAAMLAESKLKVVLVGKDGAETVLREAEAVAVDAGLILDSFEATHDRKDGAIARLEFDIAKQLGVPRKPQVKPAGKEEDF